MSNKFIPAAVVALSVLATAGSAFAHEVIEARQGFDTALAAATGQAPAQSGTNVSQIHAGSQSSNSTGPYDPAATSGDDTLWFKGR